jgi:hypothetical protein
MKKHHKYLTLSLLALSGVGGWLLTNPASWPTTAQKAPATPLTKAQISPEIAALEQPMLTPKKTDAAETPSSSESRRATDPPKGLSQKDWDSINGAMHHFQHTIKEQDGLHWARNVGERYRAKIDDRGVTLDPDGGGWQWGLELRSYTAGSEKVDVPAATTRKADGQRIDLNRDALTEWYLNDHGGLEHGWTISKPLGDSETVTFHLAARGDYTATVTEDQKTATFTDANNMARIRYAALKAFDARGKSLPATFTSSSTSGELHLAVNTAGATYPIVVDPLIQQVIAPPQGMAADREDQEFGNSVAISGDTAVVGSSLGGFLDASGEVIVFRRSGTTWSQEAYLTDSNAGEGDQFGYAVAISGDTIVVSTEQQVGSINGIGATGAICVFTRNGNIWSQQAYLKASNPGVFDWFGHSVAISGNTIVVGAHFEDSTATGGPNEGKQDSGAAYVFTRNGTIWTQQAFLKANNAGEDDRFGYSVGISGDTIVVGALLEDNSATGDPNEEALGAGAAYVFTRSASAWSQQSMLKASNAGEGDLFGWSVAISGDRIVVGAIHEDSSYSSIFNSNEGAQDSGAAYVFNRMDNTWTEEGILKPISAGAGDKFGSSVSYDGGVIVVGAHREDSTADWPNEGANDAGAVYVFGKQDSWFEITTLKASNAEANDLFGESVAVSGDTIIVGAIRENSGQKGVIPGSPTAAQTDQGTPDAGAAYIFIWGLFSYPQQAYLKPPGDIDNDFRSSAVDIFGDTVVVGAQYEDGGAQTINGNQADNSKPSSGAAYVFVRERGSWRLQAYLKASDAATNELFGSAVTIDEETIAVGAYQEVNSGAVYIYVRNGNIWNQQQKIKAGNIGTEDCFGYSVAINGDRLVVGAPCEDGDASSTTASPNDNFTNAGAVYVFARIGNTWSADGYLKANNAQREAEFGRSVGISTVFNIINSSSGIGGISFTPHIVIGSPFSDKITLTPEGFLIDYKYSVGAAYVYTRSSGSNGVWSMQAYLQASNADAFDFFGYSVGIDGGNIVVGAFGESVFNGIRQNDGDYQVGAAYVFTGSKNNWTQQAYLKASNAEARDWFGSSVDISGNTIVVGAHLKNGNSLTNGNLLLSVGAAYRYTRNGTVWSETAYLQPIDGVKQYNYFGGSVAVHGNTIVVGSSKTSSDVPDHRPTIVSVFQVDPYETWAKPFFASLNAPYAQRNADPDGDGINNFLESLAGTDPLNASSVLSATSVSTVGGNLSLTFQTVSGKKYILMKSTDLISYVPVSGQDNISATAASTTIDIGTLTLIGTQTFYKLEVLP